MGEDLSIIMKFKGEGVYIVVIYFGFAVSAPVFEEGKPCSIYYDFCVKATDCFYRFNGTNPLPSCGFKDDSPLVCCTKNEDKMFGKPGIHLADEMCNRYKEMTCPLAWNVAAAIGGTPSKPMELPFMIKKQIKPVNGPVNAPVNGLVNGSPNGWAATASIGGTPSKPLELPFMALIGYGSHNDIQWRCGGSLISERFVLSAAHCTKTTDVGPARWVKLGELDTSTDEDDAQPEIIGIIERYDHPEYNPEQVYNDITLYKLGRKVVFNKYIKPICLQTREFENRPHNALAAGWGRLGFVGKISTKLMKVIVDLFDIERCSKTSDKSQMPNGVDGNTMMCAGADEGDRDTCPGDSGGPLFQFVDERYVLHPCHTHTQYGITSFGNQCGLAEFPGVYTRVIHYIGWIESIVWARQVENPNLVWS